MEYHQYRSLNATLYFHTFTKIDVPSVSIADDLQVPVGNPITIKATIQSCPTPVSAIWQKNAGINKDDFENLDINDSKYFGSKNDPEDPRLVIPKATHEDGIYYRLVVSNGIGQSTSNTAFLKLIGGKNIFLLGKE